MERIAERKLLMLQRVLLASVLASVAFGCRGRASPPVNLLLVTVDTLRADRLGCYGYQKAETPHIDRLGTSGILFEQATAQAPVTLPSHASLLTGTYPPTHGVRDNVTYQVSRESLTVAEVLIEHGYDTAAFIGAYPLHRRFGLGQGFTHYDDAVGSQLEAPSGFFTERRAEEVVSAVLAGLEKVESPFFVWVHLFDPHIPYDPPPPFSERLADKYDGEVAYVDSQLGRLFEGLEGSGLAEETLIVLTSDHGESLGEHGERTHGFFVYDATTRVPLILKHASLGEPKRIADQVRLVDVMPTVLNLLGFPVPEEVQGNDLRPAMAGEPVDLPAFAESYVPLLNFHWSSLRSLRHRGWKYIEAPRPELYDLSRDPDESRNLVDAEPERAASMREKLMEAEERFSEAPRALARQSPDEDTRRALQSLGYLGGGLPEDVDPLSLPDPKDRIHIWDLMEEELAHLTSGRYQEAIGILSQVLEEDPENLLALEHFGYSWYHLNRIPEAERAYRRLLDLDPRRATAHVAYGSCLKKLGRREKAREHFQRAQELNPTYPKAYVRMGYLLLEEGEGQGAREQFEEALSLEPEGVLSRKGLARAHRQLGDLSRAVELYRELASESADAEILAELADALMHQGRQDEAEEVLAQSLQLDADQWRALYVQSMIRTRSGDEESAREILEKVTAQQPDFAQAHHDLGVLYAHRGDAQRAIASYRRAIELAPNALSYNGLGTVYARAGNWTAAIEHFQKAIETQADYATAYENLAQAYMAAGRPDQAEATLKKLEQNRSRSRGKQK